MTISERTRILPETVRSAAETLRRAVSRRRGPWLYRDDGVRLNEQEIVIARYFWPFGRKRIPYAAIERVTRRPLKPWHGQFRVHGIDLWGRWYPHDRARGDKDIAIDLHVGGAIRPVLTPDEPEEVLEILQRRVAKARGGDEP
jgi:hypothetical protein